MKPSSSLPRYAKAYVSESTCTRELCRPLFVSCFNCFTFVIVSPSAEMVNVLIQPASSLPPNAKAYVSESTCTRELWVLWFGANSKVATFVIVSPSAEMVNVDMKPSSSVPRYANAYVSESTCTRELCRPLSVSYSKLFPSDCVFTAVMSPSAANALGYIIPIMRKNSPKKKMTLKRSVFC